MKIKTGLMMTAGVLAMSAGAAFAQINTDKVVKQLQDQGFNRVDVKVGATQVKVEAIRGSQKVEVVYDNATGEILDQEIGRVEAGDDTTPGVEVARSSDDDFTDDDEREDDDHEDDDGNDDDGHDDDGHDDDGHDDDGHDDNGHDDNGHDDDGHDGGDDGDDGDSGDSDSGDSDGGDSDGGDGDGGDGDGGEGDGDGGEGDDD